MSLSHVCGFIATMRSTPPRRPSQPCCETRTSYHVGRPWMFEGKMLRGLTGTPMRRIALANSALAEAEPEPFTLANFTTKSLTASSLIGSPASVRVWGEVYPAVSRAGRRDAPFAWKRGAPAGAPPGPPATRDG